MRKPESRLQAKIRLALETELGGFWFKLHGSPFQQGGLPDIIGCCEGVFCGLEVKRPGEELEPLQEIAIDAIRKAGGIAARVTSPEEAVAVVCKALQGTKRRN